MLEKGSQASRAKEIYEDVEREKESFFRGRKVQNKTIIRNKRIDKVACVLWILLNTEQPVLNLSSRVCPSGFNGHEAREKTKTNKNNNVPA